MMKKAFSLFSLLFAIKRTKPNEEVIHRAFFGTFSLHECAAYCYDQWGRRQESNSRPCGLKNEFGQ